MSTGLSPAVVGPKRFRGVMSAYVAGSLLGGACLGLASAAGSVAVASVGSRGAARIAVAAIVVTYALAEAVGWSIWRPNSTWQVPAAYRRTPYIRTVGFVWGVGLGVGWLTKNSTAAFLMFFVASLVAQPPMALLAGCIFGLIRGMTLMLVIGPTTFEGVAMRLSNIRSHRLVPRLGTVALGLLLASALTV